MLGSSDRRGRRRADASGRAPRGAPRAAGEVAAAPAPFLPPALAPGHRPAWSVLVVLFVAVAAGAYPVVRRLTRRLEALKQGVEQFGAGELDHRVDGDRAATRSRGRRRASTSPPQRVEALVQSHRSLLANASHELRSPLARMKMAVSMLEGADAAQRPRLQREIDTNVAELDALVEEVLLASRLDAAATPLAARAGRPARRWRPRKAPRSTREVDGAAGDGRRRRAPAAPRAAQPAGERAPLRRQARSSATLRRRRGRAAGARARLRPRPGRAGGRCASASSSRSSGCRGTPSRPAASASGLSLVRQIAERHRGRVRCDGPRRRRQLLRAGVAGALTPASGCAQAGAPLPRRVAGAGAARRVTRASRQAQGGRGGQRQAERRRRPEAARALHPPAGSTPVTSKAAR